MSRKLTDLHPEMQGLATKFLAACRSEGIDLLVTCTLRSNAEQADLYALGRTKPGKVVTNAKPGQSMHNFGLALDVVPLRAGKPVWGATGEDGKLWKRIGEIGEAVGLEWAGRWTKMREFPHFQHPQASALRKR